MYISEHLHPTGWNDYQLIDSGNGEKLERFGPYRFVRPEAQALWSPRLQKAEWQSADGHFIASEKGGKWKLKDSLPENWHMHFEDIRFFAMPTSFRHLGFFPEQSVHWQWCADKIKKFKYNPRYSGTSNPNLTRKRMDTNRNSSKESRKNSKKTGFRGDCMNS